MVHGIPRAPDDAHPPTLTSMITTHVHNAQLQLRWERVLRKIERRFSGFVFEVLFPGIARVA